MKWLVALLTSSIGKKLVVALTGLFLCSFLVIHLLGNFALLNDDGGVAFNEYAHFMTTFIPIKIVSWGLYASILLHAIVGLLLWSKNRKAKGSKYKGGSGAKGSWASKNMALLGTLILAFIFIHMGDFWFKMKFTETLVVPGTDIKDLYGRVATAFANPLLVIAYVVGQIVLGFHLWHGFGSGFVTLGLNNKKYSPIIDNFGKIFAVLVPLGFALIPIIHFATK